MIAAGNQDLFGRLCGALDLPDLPADEQFSTMPARVLHRDVLHGLLEQRLLTSTSKDWRAQIGAAGVPVGPVNDLEAAVAEPIVAERGLLVAPLGDGPGGGIFVRVPIEDALVPKFTRPPGLGEHSVAVLQEAGFTAEETAALLAPPAPDIGGDWIDVA